MNSAACAIWHHRDSNGTGFLRPGLTVQEAVELLQANDATEQQPEMVFMEPPAASVLTDEESGDEEEDGYIRHLPGRQLLARAEVVFSNEVRTQLEPNDNVPTVFAGPSISNSSISGDNFLITSTSPDAFGEKWIQRRLLEGKPPPESIEGDFEPKRKSIFPNTVPTHPGDTPTETFAT